MKTKKLTKFVKDFDESINKKQKVRQTPNTNTIAIFIDTKI